MIYLLNAIGLSPGGSSTVHIYAQTIHRTTQNKQYIEQHNNLGECGPCPVFALNKQWTRTTYVLVRAEGRSRNHCYSGKAISITYSECVFVALVTQHARRIRRIILTSGPVWLCDNFSILSHKQQDIRGEKITEHKMRVLIFSTAFV